jgi:hypothetical protein
MSPVRRLATSTAARPPVVLVVALQALVLSSAPVYAQSAPRDGAIAANVGVSLQGNDSSPAGENGVGWLYEGMYERRVSPRVSVRGLVGTSAFDSGADPQNRRYTGAAGGFLFRGQGRHMNKFVGADVGVYFLTGKDPAFVPARDVAVRGTKAGFAGFFGVEKFLARTVALEFQGRIQAVPGSAFAVSLIGNIGLKKYIH